MSREGRAYYSSGTDDEITLRENHNSFQRVWLKPRVLVNVETVDLRTRMLGHKSALPVYVSATALGRLAHPEGEQALAHAHSAQGALYMLHTLSSCSLDEMLAARAPRQIVVSQLYVIKDRERTRQYVQRLEQAGVRALFVTVDSPQLGRREKDMCNKFCRQKQQCRRRTRRRARWTLTRA
jgi:L-lactate dehydrogenase (cytochrome)